MALPSTQKCVLDIYTLLSVARDGCLQEPQTEGHSTYHQLGKSFRYASERMPKKKYASSPKVASGYFIYYDIYDT
jgi:hypothetical protein